MVRITEALVRKKSEHNECLIGTLEELSLHQEDIEKLEHLQNWCRDLKILLLQSNLISKIENIHKLKKLEYLNLAINCIERVENLDALESLTKLDLTLNFIGELTSIECLIDNYNLRELYLTGNPCTDYPNYREYVIGTLQQLNSLDCHEIKISDKILAKKNVNKYREIIVQKQVLYAMERDEQKIRVQQQMEDLDAQMSTIEDEDERIKCFWNSKSEHCPEIRSEIAKYQQLGRQKKNCNGDANENKKPKQDIILFAPCGRPYNLNKPKLPFKFKDERNEYILELGLYKFLDTSLVDLDVQPNYVRVTVKGKIFQLQLVEEVKTTEAVAQRSQITGELLVKMPKLNYKEPLESKNSTDSKNNDKKRKEKLKEAVDVRNICDYSDVPDLI